MSQPVSLSNECYMRITRFKKTHKYKSYSDAVNALIKSYWSPQNQEILMVEMIEQMRTWLDVRGLGTEPVMEAVDRVSMRTRKALMDKKKVKQIASINTNTGQGDLK